MHKEFSWESALARSSIAAHHPYSPMGITDTTRMTAPRMATTAPIGLLAAYSLAPGRGSMDLGAGAFSGETSMTGALPSKAGAASLVLAAVSARGLPAADFRADSQVVYSAAGLRAEVSRAAASTAEAVFMVEAASVAEAASTAEAVTGN